MTPKTIGRKRGLIFIPESNGLVRAGWYVQVLPVDHPAPDRKGRPIQLWFVVPLEAIGNGRLRPHVRLAWVRPGDVLLTSFLEGIVSNRAILLSTGTGTIQTAWAFN